MKPRLGRDTQEDLRVTDATHDNIAPVMQLPKGDKGRRTRANLIAAARTIFERDGLLESRVSDITSEADVSLGTFYNYFVSKEQVFEEVVAEVNEAMLHPLTGRQTEGAVRNIEDVPAMIERNNRAYLEAYREQAEFMRRFEEAAHVHEQFRALRLARASRFATRNARTIAWLQESGHADPSLNPRYVAMALSGMVGRLAHDVFVLGQDVPFEDLVFTLTRLWLNALGLNDVPIETRRENS